jgi:hypothetical protein
MVENRSRDGAIQPETAVSVPTLSANVLFNPQSGVLRLRRPSRHEHNPPIDCSGLQRHERGIGVVERTARDRD